MSSFFGLYFVGIFLGLVFLSQCVFLVVYTYREIQKCKTREREKCFRIALIRASRIYDECYEGGRNFDKFRREMKFIFEEWNNLQISEYHWVWHDYYLMKTKYLNLVGKYKDALISINKARRHYEDETFYRREISRTVNNLREKIMKS